MKSGKQHLKGEMELLNLEKSRTLEDKETCKYLGILEADTIKQVKMTEEIKNRVSSQENQKATRDETI